MPNGPIESSYCYRLSRARRGLNSAVAASNTALDVHAAGALQDIPLHSGRNSSNRLTELLSDHESEFIVLLAPSVSSQRRCGLRQPVQAVVRGRHVSVDRYFRPEASWLLRVARRPGNR